MNSYARVRLKGKPGGQKHTVVAEAALGKPLPPRAVVHHVDGNRRNNAPSNLVICENRGYHNLLHYRERVLRAGGDPNQHRLCYACHLPKLPSAFGRRMNGRPESWCRDCRSHYAADRYRRLKWIDPPA